MSQHHNAILAILHANVDASLPKTEQTKAKRANVEVAGGKAAVDAAAKLVEAGIAPEYLFREGALIGVDAMATVEDLVKGGASVTELQKFSPSQILAGLSESELASLKPAPMVEETVEAPVAEPVVETVVVETKPEAPKVEVKVEAPKPVERFPCQTCLEMTAADQLFVPDYRKVLVLEGKPTDGFLTEAELLKHARRKKFSASHNVLADALAVVRGEAVKREKYEAKKEAEAQQKEAWQKFCRDLKCGEVGEYLGKKFRKCSYTGEVHKAELSRFPGIDVMKEHTTIKLPNGKEINVVPALEAATRRFTCGPKFQLQMKMTDDTSMTFEQLEQVIAQEMADEQKARDRAKAQRERLERQQLGGRGNQMSRADEEAGLREFRSNPDQWSGAKSGKRDGRSRNDEARAARDQFEDELAEG